MKRTFNKGGQIYRICVKCNETKHLSEFNVSKGKSLGHSYICDDCNRYRFGRDVEEGFGKCTNCLEIKPLKEFYLKNKSQNKYETQCKECKNKKYRIKHNSTRVYRKLVVEPGKLRLCSRCDKVLPDTDDYFYPSSKRWCKSCRKKYKQEKRNQQSQKHK